MRYAGIGRQRGGVNRKAVILAGDEYAPRCQIMDGVIGPVVARLHFDGGPAQSQAHDLLAKADAEQRDFFPERRSGRFAGVVAGFGVDRKSVVWGKSGAVLVGLGGPRTLNKKT